MDWVKSHKSIIGAVVGGVSITLRTLGYVHVAEAVEAVAAFLLGGGILHSDAYHKENS